MNHPENGGESFPKLVMGHAIGHVVGAAILAMLALLGGAMLAGIKREPHHEQEVAPVVWVAHVV